MDIDARVEAWASLQLLPGLGTRTLVALLKAFGGPADVLRASRASLAKLIPIEIAATTPKRFCRSCCVGSEDLAQPLSYATRKIAITPWHSLV